MVVFQSPQWFFLIPALAAVGWYWKELKFWSPFRFLALLFVVLTLADPQIRQLKRGMDLWVLVDRSESALAIVDQNFEEWKRLLTRSKPTRYDNLRFVNFAGEVVEQTGPETMKYAGTPDYTRTRLALESTIAMLEPDRHARVLMFTDGYGTEPLGDAGNKLADLGVPLDYRMLRAEEEVDYQVVSVKVPTRKRLGEPFLVEIVVRGTQDGPVDVEISRDGGEPVKEKIEIAQGQGSMQFATRIGSPGAHKYRVNLPINDAYLGNNDFESWIEITAGPRVVLASKYIDDPIAPILQAQGFDVQVVSDPATLQVGMLTGAKVLILNNVPAFEIPQNFLSAVDFFVRSQGGGLLMVGGQQSFASGGYFESSIDELLPVSMELKAEHRKLAVAMGIVMDRSGSMSMTVPGGQTKMDLANEGSARAVELLSHFDQITVYAVDSSAHQEVPLMAVGPKRKEIIQRIRRIGSMGGGIFVYTGLKACWDSLEKAKVGQRHIILFSDAADSEEPGNYKALLKEMVDKGNATVSVIGLGTPADSDAAFLEDIASRGNGRMFFTEDPTTIPNIFAQETVTVARSLFVEEPVGTEPTGQWLEISRNNFDWLSSVDGYNLSYARPEASVALVSQDEYTAPMVSFVQRGIGRSAAVSFPMGGKFSDTVRDWPKIGDFVQTMTRWLMGETLPPGIGIRTNLDGTEFTLDLLHDDQWTKRLAEPPRIFLAQEKATLIEGEFTNVREITWRRLAPGHFRATTQLEHGRMVRGAIQIGGIALPFGPIVVGGSPEWAFDPTRVEELKQAVEVSGGQELVDLSKAWTQPEVKEFASIQPWLLTILLCAVILDALFTRMGWQMPVFAGLPKVLSNLKPKPRAKSVSKPVSKSAPAAPTSVEVDSETPTTPPEVPKTKPTVESEPDTSEQRRSRFDRAKRRR